MNPKVLVLLTKLQSYIERMIDAEAIDEDVGQSISDKLYQIQDMLLEDSQ